MQLLWRSTGKWNKIVYNDQPVVINFYLWHSLAQATFFYFNFLLLRFCKRFFSGFSGMIVAAVFVLVRGVKCTQSRCCISFCEHNFMQPYAFYSIWKKEKKNMWIQYDISLVCCYLWSTGCCHALQDSRESSVFTTVDKWLRGYYISLSPWWVTLKFTYDLK